MELMRKVFRSATDEEMPLLAERLECLREAGRVLYEKHGCSTAGLVTAANGSATKLVNMLARDFGCFRDECSFEGRRKPVRFLKRAQILVADLWACFGGEGYGAFRDIDKLTMFADYRVPQMLQAMGCLYYSPGLLTTIQAKKTIDSGSNWEMQLRGELSAFPRLPEQRYLAKANGHSVQHLVRGADPARDPAAAPRRQGQRCAHRLLPVRHNEGDGGGRQGRDTAPPHTEHLVLTGWPALSLFSGAFSLLELGCFTPDGIGQWRNALSAIFGTAVVCLTTRSRYTL